MEFSVDYDYRCARKSEFPILYHGNALHTSADVLTVALQPPADDPRVGVYWSDPVTIERSSLTHLIWRIPVHEVSDGIEYHIVPPTPREVYDIELPNDEANCLPDQVCVTKHVRVFICPKPSLSTEPPEAIAMRASRGDLSGTAEPLRLILMASGFDACVNGSAAFPEVPHGVHTICDARDVKDGVHVHFVVRFDHALLVRKCLESHGFVVQDEFYHRRGLWIFSQDQQELRKRAVSHVDAMTKRLSEDHKRKRGPEVVPEASWVRQAERAIAFSVRPPLRTYVIGVLHERGSTVYTDQYLERYRDTLYDRGPALTPEQTVQLLDAYYWTHLAPPDRRIDFSDVIQFYWSAGRTVRLKRPHCITGENRGRTSVSGLKRQYSGASARRHMLLPSRHLETTPTGEEQAKNRVKPRQPSVQQRQRMELQRERDREGEDGGIGAEVGRKGNGKRKEDNKKKKKRKKKKKKGTTNKKKKGKEKKSRNKQKKEKEKTAKPKKGDREKTGRDKGTSEKTKGTERKPKRKERGKSGGAQGEEGGCEDRKEGEPSLETHDSRPSKKPRRSGDGPESSSLASMASTWHPPGSPFHRAIKEDLDACCAREIGCDESHQGEGNECRHDRYRRQKGRGVRGRFQDRTADGDHTKRRGPPPPPPLDRGGRRHHLHRRRRCLRPL